MQKLRTINRANILGIGLSALGLLAFLSAVGSRSSSTPGPSFGPSSEPSFLEEWWNRGQGKGQLAAGAPQLPAAERLALDQLVFEQAGANFPDRDQAADLSTYILAKSAEYKVSPFLILSLIYVESGFRPSVVSSQGAVGLMQLLPTTAEEIATNAGMRWHPNLLVDPKTNIDLGLRYMAQLKRQFGSEEHALTAYNIGPAALREKLDLGQEIPLEYFRRVKSRMQHYGKVVRLPRARTRSWARAWL